MNELDEALHKNAQLTFQVKELEDTIASLRFSLKTAGENYRALEATVDSQNATLVRQAKEANDLRRREDYSQHDATTRIAQVFKNLHVKLTALGMPEGITVSGRLDALVEAHATALRDLARKAATHQQAAEASLARERIKSELLVEIGRVIDPVRVGRETLPTPEIIAQLVAQSLADKSKANVGDTARLQGQERRWLRVLRVLRDGGSILLPVNTDAPHPGFAYIGTDEDTFLLKVEAELKSILDRSKVKLEDFEAESRQLHESVGKLTFDNDQLTAALVELREAITREMGEKKALTEKLAAVEREIAPLRRLRDAINKSERDGTPT
jgi:chromosome segregation ATPase